MVLRAAGDGVGPIALDEVRPVRRVVDAGPGEGGEDRGGNVGRQRETCGVAAGKAPSPRRLSFR
jgi:hypothetical protein